VPALRVEIPNAYGVSKTFKLHTDRPELLSMPPPPSSPAAAAAADAGAVQDDDGDGGAAKEDVLGSRMRYAVTVDARSNKSVQWDVNVAPATAAAATAAASSGEGERMERALIFVTDERDKIEETIELWLEILPLPTSATVSPVSSPVGGASSVMIKTVPLTITTSADLTVDARYDVIVNSVSPEFQSSGSDSGINFSVWQTLTGYTAEDKKAKKEKPPPIKYDQSPFTARNSAAPTYADVMWSDVPTSGTPEEGAAAAADSALKYIVHALAPDLSRRPKRLPSGLGKEEAYAALVAVYFRAMWQATAIAGPGCSIGMPPLGAGVFANDAADVRSAAVLAHAAYCASGGTASVSIALWSPDGTPASDMAEWQEAAGSAPVGNSVLLTRLREALGPAGQPTLLSRVPKAHTTTELTSLLKAAAKGSKDEQGPEEEDRNVEAPPPPPPLSDGGGGGESHGHGVEVARMATEFLAARADKDKAKQKQLKKQLGTTLT
jgi:O-acetyl-ADP-ribose deacetylase (regulator of RNase III)